MRMTDKRTVGFVGLGKMGMPMVARLCGAGFRVSAYDLSASARAGAASIPSCRSVSSLAGVTEEADCVITMLPNGEVVRRAVLGDQGAHDGVASTMSPGGVLIDMSSSAPWETIKLDQDLEDRGISLIDAPVSGGVARAVTGELSVFAGGSKDVLERVQPILAPIGNKLFYAGALGSGHAVKALNNLLSAAGFAATIEVLSIARAYGIDPDVFTEIVNASSGSNNTTHAKLRQFVLSEAYNSGFGTGLMVKDLGTASELASIHDVDTPLCDEVVNLWGAAREYLGDDSDHTEFARYVKERSE